MRRWLTLPVTLLFALAPATAAVGDQAPARPVGRAEPPITRAEVLAGRASDEQTLDLMKRSVEAAGGVTVESPEAETLGGWAYPLLAIDLDGDGDEETLLEQWAKRSYIVAVDERGVLWRQKLPKNSYIVGALPADLSPGGSQEVLLVAFRYKKPRRAQLAAAGSDGVQWATSVPADYFELNGLVDADGDAEDEVALTVWNADEPLTIHTLDGEDGSTISELSSTPAETADLGWSTEGFVTDGIGDQTDQAIFVTDVVAGFYAERRSLADGSQTEYELLPDGNYPMLYQGPDYTGDGRRDAFVDYWEEFGVFNGADLGVSWSTPYSGDPGTYAYPYRAADIDGDGGEEVCLALDIWVYDPETYRTLEVGAGARCHSGKTGAALWEASISHTIEGQENAYAYTWAGSDLNGDGHPDPVLQMESYECIETGEYWECNTVEFEALALSGVDGSSLWSVADPEASDTVWGLTDSNLDGTPGDDGFDWIYNEEETPDAPFAIRNGLDLTLSWEGTFDTGELPGYVDGVIESDVDGDGAGEVVMTAEGYEILGDPDCDGPCLYVSYAYVAAFEPGGELLWQLEL